LEADNRILALLKPAWIKKKTPPKC